jgi:hypothetical protein
MLQLGFWYHVFAFVRFVGWDTTSMEGHRLRGVMMALLAYVLLLATLTQNQISLFDCFA